MKFPKISLPSKDKGNEGKEGELDEVSGDPDKGPKTVVIDNDEVELSGEEKKTGDGSEDESDDDDSDDSDFNNDKKGGEGGDRKALKLAISGVVVLVLCHLTDFVGKVQCLPKIIEPILLLKVMLIGDSPSRNQLPTQHLKFGPLQGWNPTAARHTFLLCKFAHHFLSSPARPPTS